MEALLQLVSQDRPKYVRLAQRRLSSIEDAEDVVQNACLLAFRRIGQFEGRSQFSTWFGRIVLNCANMHNRKHSEDQFSFVGMDEVVTDKLKVADTLSDSSYKLPEEEYLYQEKRRRVFEATQLLSSIERQTVLLRMRGFTYLEIAKTLGAPVGTVKATVSRGKLRLKKYVTGTTGRRLYNEPRTPSIGH